MTNLNQHDLLGPTNVSHGMLRMYETVSLVLCDQFSRSTMCGGIAITHSESLNMQELYELPFSFERLDSECSE